MKVEVLANFDFDKLNKKWTNEIKKDIFAKVSEDTANRWKKNIKEKSFTPLKKSTIDIRKYRKSSGGSKPLFDTGALYKSIEPQKRSVKHLAYGEYHLERHKTSGNSMIPNKTVPARKWKDKRYALLTDKTKKNVLKRIRLGLRLAGRGKIIAKY